MNPTPMHLVRRGLAAGLVWLPAPLLARTFDSDTDSLLAGCVHPFIEPVHLAALLTIGIASALLAGRSRWGVPLLYLLLTAFGFVLASQGAVAPLPHTIVLTTGFGLALLLLGRVRMGFALVSTVAGAFGLFHGVADGALAFAGAAAGAYCAGYAAGNVIGLTLSGAMGRALEEWTARRRRDWWEHTRSSWSHFSGFRLGH